MSHRAESTSGGRAKIFRAIIGKHRGERLLEKGEPAEWSWEGVQKSSNGLVGDKPNLRAVSDKKEGSRLAPLLISAIDN
jgi:hypothetical protein